MARLPDPAVRKRWQRLIDLHAQCDFSIADFCDIHDLSTASFYAWRRRLAQTQPTDGLVQVEIATSQTPVKQPASLLFKCGTRLEIDTEDLNTLLKVVDRLRENQTAVVQ